MNANDMATTSIRRSRVRNIDDQRLLIRARQLRHDLTGGRSFPTRIKMAERAAELHAIRSELVRRHGAGATLLAPSGANLAYPSVLAVEAALIRSALSPA